MAIYRFNRYEIKYILHRADADDLIEAMNHRIRLDPYAGQTGAYRIASVYYDSSDLRFYWEKVDGLRLRRKVRLRAYLDSESQIAGKAFLEIKQRDNLTVQKRRLDLPFEEGLAFMESGSLAENYCGDISNEILFLRKYHDLRPVTTIFYQRQPFVAKLEPELRITIDSNVRANYGYLPPAKSNMGKFLMPPEKVILELKFNERMPTWLSALAARHNLTLWRVSKYCLGVEALRRNYRSAV